MASTLNAVVPVGDGNPYNHFVFNDIDLSLLDLPFFDDPLPMRDDSSRYHGFYVHEEQQMPQLRQFAFDSPADDHEMSSSSLQAFASGSGSDPASDQERSPWARGRVGHQFSDQSTVVPGAGITEMESGSSLSPVEKPILTPESDRVDYAHEEDQEDAGDTYELSSNISPASPTHTIDTDFVVVHRSALAGRSATFARMNNRTLPSTTGSGASRASSIAGPASATSETSYLGMQWGNFLPSNGAAHNHSDLFSHLGDNFDSSTFGAADHLDNNAFLDMNTVNDGSVAGFDPYLSLYGSGDDIPVQNTHFVRPQFGRPFAHHGHDRHGQHGPHTGQRVNAQYPAAQIYGMDRAPGINPYPDQQVDLRSMPSYAAQIQLMPTQIHATPAGGRGSMPTNDMSRTSPPQPAFLPISQQTRPKQRMGPPHSSLQPKSIAAPMQRPLHPMIKPDPGAVVPSNVAGRPSHAENGRKGGRQRNSHLAEEARQKSHKMRKITACWRCALQRDPCDDGSPCKRCIMRPIKAGHQYFDCDRSKLPDFMSDFLPPSMTLMHKRQSIEDCVKDQVIQWYSQRPIDVYLTSGYGQPLIWKVYEFRPKGNELLGQLQYLQNPNTGASQRYNKYSPPFGLLKLDSSDEAHFEEYLDQLMDPRYLWDFGWTCFEEETQVDKDGFQATLLDLLCKLYVERNARDYNDDLRDLLEQIIRMIIITYIMGHTLTIVEDTLPTVISNVRHSPRPENMVPHTSPKLANRQLKFFFSHLRDKIYERILKWAQQVLHTSGKKESTWFPVFCAMLGFAMVLEEVQVTIQIQADAKIAKGEAPPEHAYTEAENACERIDGRFKLMVGIFQCKYRDKKWGEYGTFGSGTPELRDPASIDFLRRLRALVVEKQAHLEYRRDVPLLHKNQCRYTSRLVARFLLPFLDLPPS